MQLRNLQHLVLAASLTSLLFACKKSNSDSTMSQSDLSAQSSDQTQVNTETDASLDDVNSVLISETSVTGSTTGRPLVEVTGGNQDTVKSPICDATVTVDTVDNPRTITITYNGSSCNGWHSRTGSIVISFAKGMIWHNAGAVVTLTFNNLKITRTMDGKSIVINGTHTYTNVSGGSLADLNENNAGPIIHTVTSDNMSITFDNGTARTWNVARQRSFTYNDGLVISTTGTHTDGSVTGISEWGVNRFGNDFTASITSPLVVSESCSYQLTSGSDTLTNAAGTTTVTFGLDSTGAATGCPLSGGYFYFKWVFTGKGGKTYTAILPY